MPAHVITTDPRLSDQRPPTDASVTLAKLAPGFSLPAANVAADVATQAELDAQAITLGNNNLTAGLCLLDRDVAVGNVAAWSSGQMVIGYIQAKRAESLSQVVIATGTTLAAATPTLIRIGVWSGAGTALVASTPNDTTLLAAANTAYTKAFSAAFTTVAGEWYAVGILVVSAAAMPSFLGVTTPASNVPQTEWARAPRLTAVLAGQADLPANLTGISNTTRRIQAVLLP